MSNHLGIRIERWIYKILIVHAPGGDDGGGGF